MMRIFNRTEVEVVEGDITRIEVDAIVNAANSRLRGGGGVDGAIHRAGGAAILEDCKRYEGCPTGEAVITTAGRLPARFVIHTVGPVYREGDPSMEVLLGSCYRNSLNLAVQNACNIVSFPSISTGVYGYPFDEACQVALSSIQSFVMQDDSLDRILLVAYGASDASRYAGLLETFGT